MIQFKYEQLESESGTSMASTLNVVDNRVLTTCSDIAAEAAQSDESIAINRDYGIEEKLFGLFEKGISVYYIIKSHKRNSILKAERLASIVCRLYVLGE
jgi:hypothetical protein